MILEVPYFLGQALCFRTAVSDVQNGHVQFLVDGL